MPEESLAIAAVLLACTAAIGLLLAARLQPSRPDQFRRQLEAIAAGGGGQARKDGGDGVPGPRGRSVRETLREIEEAQRRRRRPSLRLRLRQAGLDWTRRHYAGVVAALALTVAGFGWLLGAAPAVALPLGLAAGLGLPEGYLRILRRRRLALMVEEFPNAVDVIVRGVKTGLPFPDCLRIIAREAQEPLASEFAGIVRDQAVGLPIDEAVDRFAHRVPLAEANFFSIVIAIQSRSGGSIAEALSNLATVLRERKKMRGKIKAMSSEAKASGAIIGALPVVVTFIVYLTSPDYISLLFDTMTGRMVLGACVFWMAIGVVVMRQMISFDF